MATPVTRGVTGVHRRYRKAEAARPNRALKNEVTNLSPVDRLRAAWKRLGVQFTIEPSQEPTDIEALIVETAMVGPTDERLIVGAASWLACYHAFVNGRRLSALVMHAEKQVTAYIGVLLSLAIEGSEGAGRAQEFEAALARCVPLSQPRPLYDVMSALPVLRERVQTETLLFYAHWGLWHDDAMLKLASVRPLAWLLQVPELRARALFGPSVEADIMARALVGHSTARAIARDTGVSYAAAHAAADRLVHRGMLVRHRQGVHQELHLSDYARPILTFPTPKRSPYTNM